MKTVLIADGNRRLGALMAELLDDDHRFDVVDVVTTHQAAVEAVLRHDPEVVLVSEVLDGAPGTATCAAVRAVASRPALLLWTHDVAGASAAGEGDVDGLLERGMTYRELAQAVRHARRAPHVVDLVADRPARSRRG